jgi:hypothetical protein
MKMKHVKGCYIQLWRNTTQSKCYTTNTTLMPSFNHCGLEKWPALNVLTLQHIGLHHKSPQLLSNALMTFCKLYVISDVHKTVTVLSVSSDLTNTQTLWNLIHTLVIMLGIHGCQQRSFWKQFKYSFPFFMCNYTEKFELLNFPVIPSMSFSHYLLLEWQVKQPYLWRRTWVCKA